MFETTLLPHRSLPPAGYWVLIGCIAASNLLLGLWFLSLGAWPVMLLCTLSVAAVHLAFARNYAVAQRVRERVWLTDRDLVIERVEANGTVCRRSFNRYWVRVVIEEEDEDSNRLWVGSHGKRLLLGEFLSPGERQAVAAALNDALRSSSSG